MRSRTAICAARASAERDLEISEVEKFILYVVPLSPTTTKACGQSGTIPLVFRQSSGRIITSGTSSTIGTFERLERPTSYGGHVIRAPEFASVSCYLSVAVSVTRIAQLSSGAQKTASANALEMTISSWVGPEYPPLPSLFALNRRRAWEFWVSSRQSWVRC